MSLQQTHPELGKAAPDILGQSLNGNRVALSGYRGKVVVVTFWASWCRACLDRIPEENRLANDLRESPFVLLGVNGDQAIDDARKAMAQHGIDFDSLWDDPNVEPTIVSRWGVTQWPTTFVLDKSGVIRNKDLAGPELRVAVVKLLDEHSESVPETEVPGEQSHALEPADGSVSNGEPSPPAQ
jgi:thiol-disulfide isomerase/thioredoxin